MINAERPIYLDCAASTPVHPDVRDALVRSLDPTIGNASSTDHIFGLNAAKLIQDAREKVACAAGARTEAVVFTSGATEANNLSIFGLVHYGKQTGKQHIISTQIEHKAVLEPLAQLSKNGFEVEFVQPSTTGLIDPKEISYRLRRDTLLVSVMHVNNETGVIQPIPEISAALEGHDAYLHVDAAQGFLKEPSIYRNNRIDFLTVSAHKIFGPQGVGALIGMSGTRRMRPLSPIIVGGGQERALRAGTQPVALIAGFGVAVETLQNEASQWNAHCRKIQTTLINQINALGGKINGDMKHLLPNILNFQLPNIDADAFLLANKNNLLAARGSACTSRTKDTSHVLNAMGLKPEETERCLRFSWSHMTPRIDKHFLKDALSNLR